ncbi:hypothetical protein CA13_41700 [Planctomycetes bacterium CA13]|uniref:Cytoplasmic glycerophosphodiester phosphodiesterase n=1 Tax=Novipirellula herctigrandis TaxID=2527986 RepID=A0A5C5Z6I4_9BACT|nr:hypothetical protein CA13_41700 [Planctomycetes bacterium CA13]
MKIDLLAHRGAWNDPDEQNQSIAFERALSAGFGIETDVRDHRGKLIVSHDPLTQDENDCLCLDDFCRLYRKLNANSCLALNIKSDGLAAKVQEILTHHDINNFFVFDMSIPDMLGYLNQSLPCFTRQSEFEHSPVLYEQSSGVWLDAFESTWFDAGLIETHLANRKNVCVVSSELHGRSREQLWPMLRQFIDRNDSDAKLMLCTDFPHDFHHDDQGVLQDSQRFLA